jgi:fibronectin type 3 domain-containing protein
MNASQRNLVLGLILTAAVAAGCSKDHGLSPNYSPVDPRGGADKPPVPTRLSAAVGNRSVALSWSLPDSADAATVRLYRIYKQTTLDEPASVTDSSTTSPKTLIDLTNGRTILLSVSAVLTNGLEGKRSAEVEVSPALSVVTIDGGSEVTGSRSVTLTFTGPAGATGVVLGSKSDLTDAVSLNYATTVSWTLPEGDGEKTVYARITDGLGNPSQIISDTIRLDTRAEIVSFDFEGAEVRTPGDAIVFRMDTREPLGSAEVEIPRGGTRRELRDDGVSPDQSANDGVYTLQYVAERNQQFLGGEIVGHFSDEAGNTAPERSGTRRLTVHAAPPALVLSPPASSDPQEIELEWSRAPEGVPFGSYRLYRGDAPGVADAAARRLITEVQDPSAVRHSDSGVEPGRVYYYVVELVDPLGAETPSNEVSGSAKLNQPPAAVLLALPYAVTEKSVSLSWSRNADVDFSLYRVLRAEHPSVMSDPTRRTLTEIRERATTAYVDEAEMEQGQTYYYVVEAVDDLGLGAGSNERSATLDDLYPSAVELSAPGPAGETSIGLVWTANAELDFESYRLYRSSTAGVGETADLITTLPESERTRWTDGGLVENTDYYYRVFVRDKGGNLTPSNEIKVTTENVDPTAVTLNAPTEVTGTTTSTVDLSWTASAAHDFDAYHVYRDTSPAVGEGSTLVRAIDASSTTTYRDAGLADNTRYYYRVFVLDNAGGSSGSTERSIVTANRAPTPVTLTVSGSTTTSISLSWSANVNSDFFEYRLMRGSAPSQITQTVATFSRVEQITYTDYLPSQSPDVDVFYKVVVADKDIDDGTSLTSDSNIVSARVRQ